jgi:imidazolonepropionase-like amidohydrolase
MRFAVKLALGLAAIVGTAQAAETPQPVVLKAAYLFDARSGQLTNGGAIVVEGDKIKAVGAQDAPANAKVIDLGDATLMPGFIDAHTHITSEGQEDFYKGFHAEMYRFAAEQSFYAAVYAKRTLEAGFTTVRNVGAGEFVDVGLRNAINTGIAEGPTILTAVHAIGSTGGHCDQGPFPPDRIEPLGPMDGVCNGADECRAAVRYQLKWGADVIKICSSGGVLSEADPVDVPQLTPDELTAIMSEAHAWKRKVAAHAHGDLAARQAIEAGAGDRGQGAGHAARTRTDVPLGVEDWRADCFRHRLGRVTARHECQGVPVAGGHRHAAVGGFARRHA